MKIEFFRHNIGDEEIRRVNEVLRSIFLTTGEVVGQFESKFADYLGCRDAIGVTSCTAAMHLSFLAHGIGPGDEVITTPLTFVATATSILHAGAVPVFVDVEPETGNLDAREIRRFIKDHCLWEAPKGLVNRRSGRRIKAIVPVHLYGHLCDMREIRGIADEFGLKVIEDAAHCIEGERDGVRPGQLGDAACFSFYATKNITCGEGGAVATNDPVLAEKIRVLRLHGITKNAADRYTRRYEHWEMELLGWKYNMDNIQAALLINQLERIEERWKRRKEIAQQYERAFAGAKGIDFPKVLAETKSARHLFTIWVDPAERDRLLWESQDAGIGVAVNFRAIHLLKYFQQTFGFQRGAFKAAERIGDRTLSLPLYPQLKDEEIRYVISTVRKLVS